MRDQLLRLIALLDDGMPMSEVSISGADHIAVLVDSPADLDRWAERLGAQPEYHYDWHDDGEVHFHVRAEGFYVKYFVQDIPEDLDHFENVGAV